MASALGAGVVSAAFEALPVLDLLETVSSESANRSAGLIERASQRSSNCSMEGICSLFSNLLKMERLMPVFSDNSSCVSFCALRADLIVSDNLVKVSFPMFFLLI